MSDWLDVAVLVLVARRLVEAFGRRGSWVLAAHMQTGVGLSMWSPATQGALDRAVDAGRIVVLAGTTRTVLTGKGLDALRAAFNPGRLVSLGAIEYVEVDVPA
jgi:hypothetical protein